ncbi:ABC transporter substrate-binding protein [Acidisphaera sp. L21]|uniref:ABC transporter substrate-binding protein n=1 Tax=Acidisphaera sp. L21 TaxID=1641851 RepID=UPI00131E6571|nr:extracellular solute-binding protein [Acidisphaera sp. L21]
MTVRLVLAALFVTGPALAATPSPVVEGETIATPELVAAACAEGKVTYYTAQRDADERQIVQKFQQAFPCIQVSVISAVTGRLYERLQTESQAGKTQADLTIITDEALTQRMIDAKMLRPWTPPQAAMFAANAKQQGWWYGASGALMYMIYNTQSLTAAEAPKSWADLLDAKWKGNVSMAAVTTGGTSWVQFDFMKQSMPATYLPALAAQESKIFSTYAAVVQSVARGETTVGITDSLDDYPLRVGQGAPIQPVYPSEGIPFVNYPMMLLAGAPHPNAAELFGNWYLSKAAQTELVRLRGVYSFRPDVAPAPGNPPLSGMKLWNPGHDTVLRDHDSLVTDVVAIFGRR